MREMVLPIEISKALIDFKVGEMAIEMEKAIKEGVEKFKTEELPDQLQSEFVRGVKAFPYTEEGEKYLREEWGAGLVEYRDAVLHYHPNLDAREIDRHFPKIFSHSRIEGETLPEIIVKESPAVEAVVGVAPSGNAASVEPPEVAPTTAIDRDGPALS